MNPLDALDGWDFVNGRPMVKVPIRLFEDDHGLTCAECRRRISRGQPYCDRLTGFFDDGEPVSELVCVYCYFRGETMSEDDVPHEATHPGDTTAESS